MDASTWTAAFGQCLAALNFRYEPLSQETSLHTTKCVLSCHTCANRLRGQSELGCILMSPIALQVTDPANSGNNTQLLKVLDLYTYPPKLAQSYNRGCKPCCKPHWAGFASHPTIVPAAPPRAPCCMNDDRGGLFNGHLQGSTSKDAFRWPSLHRLAGWGNPV